MGKPWENGELPSGEPTQRTGQPPCYSWENEHDFDWAIFNSHVSLPEGNSLRLEMADLQLIYHEYLQLCECTRGYGKYCHGEI